MILSQDGTQPFQSSSDLQSPPFSPPTNGQAGGHMIPHPHQRLSYQISTQPNSSFASHEDLQCNWSESRQSISEAATPREHRHGETGDVIGQTLPQDSYCQAYLDMPVTSKAKALSLRELVRLKNIGKTN